MLRASLAELHTEGTPLAALYPATLPFYQRAGYERAGQRITYELPLDAIGVDEQGIELVPVPAGHYDEIYRAYEQRARRASGNLARPEWMWRNKLEPKDRKTFRYLVTRDGQTEGYVVFTQGGRTDPLTVLDVCALTPAAGRRLLAFFAGYRSMVETLTWNGGPFDPFVYLLKEPLVAANRSRVKVVRSLDWMLRIVDVAGALTARGYAPGLQAELHLEVRDDVLPSNNGRFVVAVADGDARVRPGGAGRIRLGVRELAAIYTGFMAPAELCALGDVDAPDADLALMGAAFAGSRPWIADMF
jgi:predicted acetyltransferase